MDLPQPHTNLWFLDGSVVLKTESYLFRVHKSILARESTVFNDMFAFPVKGEHAVESSDDLDEYEGLPLVPLIGDDETAVVHLLTMIYKPNYSLVRKPLLKLPCAVGLFKLSNKYHFSAIEEAFQTELKIAFPSTRAAFGQAESSDIRYSMFLHGNLLPLLPMIEDASLAKSCPSLFYSCSQYSIHDIVAANLPPKTMEVLLCGREAIKERIHRILSERVELYHIGMSCCERSMLAQCRSAACFAEFNTISQSQMETVSSSGGEFFTLKAIDEVQTSITLCNPCKKEIQSQMDRFRDQIWVALPEIFKLTVLTN
ncbi:hypothetical protein SCHPADRAFT_1000470 [Schizopora paradoxa]|uniref:BTB domain-containing protein n=1 Tax=Schizopora paradoxa TaxID=27342 RepID=A0A0H2RWG6_9AGAM|nr:hypothetical protein SCHPADRAFT_1000470 [Schizopora paradoxa]